MTEADLQSGDCLVFSRKGLFDSIIRIKTFSIPTHIEIYIGLGNTVAARNGEGVAIYKLDLNGLYAVLRPPIYQTSSFNHAAAFIEFYDKWNGKPYGWLALLEFCLIDLHSQNLFCSELTTMFYRAGGFEPFQPHIRADRVCPGDFDKVNDSVMKRIWTAPAK